MSWSKTYRKERDRLASDPSEIVALEQTVHDQLLEVIIEVAPAIASDWQFATDTRPQWIEAAPKQRGRGASGTGVPWIEVAEYVPISHIGAELARRSGLLTSFPGLPAGGDLRYANDDLLLHLDAKAAGPNDLHDEVVVPPYQVSGNGALVNNAAMPGGKAVKNDPITFTGQRNGRARQFFPGLPPLYVSRGSVRLCITAFIKVVYAVRSLGDQPLLHITLATLPNGILLSDGGLASTPTLFAPGKDATSKPLRDRRARVKFAGLVSIAAWRVACVSEASTGTGWIAESGRWEPSS